MTNPQFFSQEWCDRALEVSNASERIYKGFKDAPSFSNLLVFEATDKEVGRLGLYVSGYIKQWAAADFPDTEVFSRFAADLDVWRIAAEKKPAGLPVADGREKIRLRRGPLQAAIENAPAFNAFLQSWGDVPTDWDI